ncbi:swr complex subunit [Vermiconidia calcicola]|uniref:Swr complex subunit n=1 Tax=Vermiconidia calcicola TaxID=1690605 RepID=A0ACC3MTA0_9PEZI|nr:swr complex subunit [Vermiconidia calcicola]
MAHQIESVSLDNDEDGESYDENADEDFNPEAAAAAEEGEDASSSSADEGKAETTAKKRKATASPAIEDGLDSGDEATIQEQRRKRKRRKHDDVDAGEESGGEGGLIKTRAQRLAEKVEKKSRKRAGEGEVTIDVDTVWEELSRIPIGRPREKDTHVMVGDGETMDVDGEADKENVDSTSISHKRDDGDDEELITIKRHVEFAGEITEITERVPKNSKEAQRYLASTKSCTNKRSLHRPLRRPSLFEPNPSALIKGVPPDRLRPRAPSRFDVVQAAQRAQEDETKRAEKMTTVQKSALDWRGFVEKETGLREELDEYGKSKRGYLAREDFLRRVEGARDMAAKAARLKG